MANQFHVQEHVVPSQYVREYPRAIASSQEDMLYLSVKQYTPKDSLPPQLGDVTIIGAHANGFPKELYEAMWADIHTLSGQHKFRIRSIWIADMTNHGASAALNDGKLGNDPSWSDHARDLLYMINIFRDKMERPLIGIGHSFGGAILAQLALLHPRLLTSLILLDATITRFSFGLGGVGVKPAQLAIKRRELWSSRQAAEAAFVKSPFYRKWDRRVLEAWFTHGIRRTPTALFPEEPDGSMTLATTKHQETFTYFRPLYPYIVYKRSAGENVQKVIDRRRAPDFDEALSDELNYDLDFPFYRAEGPNILKRLPELRPSVLWLFAGNSDLGTPEQRQYKMDNTGTGVYGSGGAKEGRVSEVVFEGMDHLFPMEVPFLCAAHAARWIEQEIRAFCEEQREYLEWAKLPYREKSTLGEEYVSSAKGGRAPKL
jgi:pimeloyl-ACP methyl ester carboxylesterase